MARVSTRTGAGKNWYQFIANLHSTRFIQFVLTPEFVYVMKKKKKENKNFKRFVNLSCKAFNIIRKHAHHIITMFSLVSSPLNHD